MSQHHHNISFVLEMLWGCCGRFDQHGHNMSQHATTNVVRMFSSLVYHLIYDAFLDTKLEVLLIPKTIWGDILCNKSCESNYDKWISFTVNPGHWKKFSGSGRSQTHDLQVTCPLLYHLSYRAINGNSALVKLNDLTCVQDIPATNICNMYTCVTCKKQITD